MDKPYDRISFRGHTVDRITAEALKIAEKRLGYELTILQGSYHPGFGPSAGTHDGGGVVDLAPFDQARKVRVLRKIGFAAWYRTAIPGLWGPHVHAVLIGNEKLSAAAADQVVAYRARRDGLASNDVDRTWHPDPIPVFTWPPRLVLSRGARVDAAIKNLTAASERTMPVARRAKIEAALEALKSIERIRRAA